MRKQKIKKPILFLLQPKEEIEGLTFNPPVIIFKPGGRR